MAPVRHSHSISVGVSKAQAGLAKIIAIIATLSPPRIERGSCNSEAARVGGFALGLDLNLRLGPPPEIGGGSSGNEDDEGGGFTAQSGVVVESRKESTVDRGSRSAPQAGEVSSAISPAERSSKGECDPEEGGEESRKKAKESSAITTAPSRKADDHDEDEEAVVEVIKKEHDQEEKKTKGSDGSGGEKGGWNHSKFDGSEGYLDLLLEAVRQISGGLFEEELGKEKAPEEEKVLERIAVGVAQGSKRRGTEWPLFHLGDDSAPIVRSKRGRSQTLPSRFRDSILDPWRKLPTVTRHGRTARPSNCPVRLP